MDQILHISNRKTLKRNIFLGVAAFALFKVVYSYRGESNAVN